METGSRRRVLPAHALGGARQVAEGGAEGVVRGRESAHALAIARHGDGNRGARAINVAIGWMSVGVRRPSPASGQPRATIAPVFARVCGVEGWTTMLICCDEQQNRILRTVGKLHRPDRVASGDGSVARVFQPLIKRAPSPSLRHRRRTQPCRPPHASSTSRTSRHQPIPNPQTAAPATAPPPRRPPPSSPQLPARHPSRPQERRARPRKPQPRRRP